MFLEVHPGKYETQRISVSVFVDEDKRFNKFSAFLLYASLLYNLNN